MQEVWIRWQSTDRTAVRDAAAFLAKTTTRLAINVIQSARSRREANVGVLPRQSVGISADFELGAEQSEALESAVVILLEKLSPVERAAYVLREAFDYSYREIAKILRCGEANSRQLVTRARRHVADGRQTAVNSAEQQSFLAAFAAAQEGALTALESFFRRNEDSTDWVDGGRGDCDVPSSPVDGRRYPNVTRKWRSPFGDGRVAPWRVSRRKLFAADKPKECVHIIVEKRDQRPSHF